MQRKAQKLRRYEKRNKFYRQNVIFKRDAKKFYREIGKQPITVDDAPSIEEIEDFWKDIGSEEKGFNEQAEWMKHTEEINVKKQHQEWNKISKDELDFALNKSHKWKSPGMDKIHIFWISSLSRGHEKLASLLSIIPCLSTIIP